MGSAATPGWASPSDDLELADAGLAACGHGALAAATGKSVREILPHFTKQGSGLWVSEKRMRIAIASAGYVWDDVGLPWPPQMAVAWIQGLGSWMNPGVPIGARNARTHWIATQRDESGQWVYDINIGAWIPRMTWVRDIMRPMCEAWKAKDFKIRATLGVRPNNDQALATAESNPNQHAK